MKRDFKIWMAILGIVAAGSGITSFTRSYVSGKRIQMTAAEFQEDEIAADAPFAGFEAEGQMAAGGINGEEAVTAAGDQISERELSAGAAQEAAPAEDFLEEVQEEAASTPDFQKAQSEAEDFIEQDGGPAAAFESALPETEMVLAEQTDKSAVQETLFETVSETPSREKLAEVTGETKIVIVKTEDYQTRLEEYQTRLPELDEQIQRMRNTDTDNTVQSVKATVRTEQRIWERELDAVYTLLIVSLEEEQSSELRADQQQWIQQRDSIAQEASKKSSGSMESVEYMASITASTRERVYQLVERYQE